MRRFILIDYADKAKSFCTGGPSNLRLYYYIVDNSGKKHLTRIEFFSEHRIKEAIKDNIPVIDVSNQSFALSCMSPPKRSIYFGYALW